MKTNNKLIQCVMNVKSRGIPTIFIGFIGKILAIFCGLSLSSSVMQAREFPSKDSSSYLSMKMTGIVRKGDVCLRWAAENEETWRELLEKGLVLERYAWDTLDLIDTSSFQHNDPIWNLQRDTIPPLCESVHLYDTDSEEWSSHLLLAQMAGCINDTSMLFMMGDTLMGQGQSWVDKLLAERQDAQMRYLFSHLMLDRSFPLACDVGMGMVDSSVGRGSVYLYRLYIPQSSLTQDTAYFFTKMENNLYLPPMEKLQTEWKDSTVSLRWFHEPWKRLCIGYYVERVSVPLLGKGKFQRLNEIPYMSLSDDHVQYLQYLDSIPDIRNTYRYRVLGVDVFGNEYKVAESEPGNAVQRLAHAPRIDSVGLVSTGKIRIYWDFPGDQDENVDGFSLYVGSSPLSNPANGHFLSRGKKKSRSMDIDVDRLSSSSYFYLSADAVKGKSLFSLPFFYQMVDSFPPFPPSEMTAEIDSSGKVILLWNRSSSNDVAGYRIFWKNNPSSFPVQLSQDLCLDTTYSDSVSLTSGQAFYYAVKAEDSWGNLSELGPWVEVRNLKRRRPHAPVFSHQTVLDGERLDLVCFPSPSPEVCRHHLYLDSGQGWQLLHVWEPVKESGQEELLYTYIFPETLGECHLRFRVTAISCGGVVDSSSTPFDYQLTYRPKLRLPRLQVVADRDNFLVHLQWKEKNLSEIRKMIIFREDGEGEVQLLESLSEEDIEKGYYVDGSVKINNLYGYFIQVETKDGFWTDYSRKYWVEY